MKARLRLRWRIVAGVVFFYVLWAAVQWLTPLPEAAARFRGFIRTQYHSRVYQDHGNIVLEQGKSGGVEYGKYIVPRESSYFPLAQQGGFLLGPATEHITGGGGTGAAVYDYQRGQPDGAAIASQHFRFEWTNSASPAAGLRR